MGTEYLGSTRKWKEQQAATHPRLTSSLNGPLRGSRRLCLIPSPVLLGRQEDDQEDQAGRDDTCDDKMAFEKMPTQTHKLIMNLSQRHTRR